ncbi:MAG: hypothetical protein KGL39_60165 [Patescibacteria group bacterium]|nr:hypothetical protein [Patescibacteria group bacterium]
MTPTEQLIDLTKRWNDHEDIPRSQQLECKKIGEKINAQGGFAAMQEAYRAARRANPMTHVIQAYWDGIGDWRW